MNTAQITRSTQNKILQQATNFVACFLAIIYHRRSTNIRADLSANTDPSTEPGTHWVAFYFPSEEKGESFDSYGQPPEQYRDLFRDFLEPYEWQFNTRKLQSAWSDVCGQYCIFYLSHRARGLSMNKIVQTCSYLLTILC